MSITVFVDTNIFLSLYAFSDDDIEQFRSLFVLSQEGVIDFLLPQQVIDEFWRNREAKIRESIDNLKVSKRIAIPALARDLPQAGSLISAQKDLIESNRLLVEELLGSGLIASR